MAIYFVYNLDEQGRIAKRREIEAPCDAEAIAAGQATMTNTDESAHGFEVWLGNKMVFQATQLDRADLAARRERRIRHQTREE